MSAIGSPPDPAEDRRPPESPTAAAEQPEQQATERAVPAPAPDALADPVADAGVGSRTGSATEAEPATATATAVPAPASTATRAPDEPGRPPNRAPKPVLAAAAVAGLVLLAVPIALVGLFNRDHRPPPPPPQDPSAYQDGSVALPGFVPDVRQDPTPPPNAVPAVPGPPPADQGGGRGAEVPPPAPDTGGASPGTPPPAENTADRAPARPAFAAVGGPGCAGSSFSRPGYFTDGSNGWTQGRGAFAAEGCDGSFSSLPMSGDRNRDHDNAAIWRFTTGDVRVGSCQVSVFVPQGDRTAVGGDPSYYTVYQTDRTDRPVGDFRISQVDHQGQWVQAGTFPVNSGMVTVKLHDRGIDWTDKGPNHAHHAAAQLRVQCSA
ncbi:hypothetical protein [Saccharopolyspora rosea]|uniref:Translation initiation factor IF-2 n=1 Tax=Saccharopolyspora rosea TaxID=524884 RepID=A0ABW3FIL8_9PSEU|nr:hypothetical protein [Saccharopolyspora rosea]